jgi:hypothetical protein
MNADFKADRQFLVERFAFYKELLAEDAIRSIQEELGLGSLRFSKNKALLVLELQKRYPDTLKSTTPKAEKPTDATLGATLLFRLFGSPKTEKELKSNAKDLMIEFHPDRGPDRGGDEDIYSQLSFIQQKLSDDWEGLHELPSSHPRIKRMVNYRANRLDFDAEKVLSYWKTIRN